MNLHLLFRDLREILIKIAARNAAPKIKLSFSGQKYKIVAMATR